MTVPTGLEAVLNINPEIIHGDLCFTGTRVPLTVLMDNLAAGLSIEDFTRNYPSVTGEQIKAVIDWQTEAKPKQPANP